MAAMLRALGFGFALALFATTVSLASAADRTMILKLGATSVLLLERPFKAVLIGDPNVVDVLTGDDRSVILRPLKLGETNIIFLDERSIVITNVGILVCKTDASRILFRNRSDCDPVDDSPT
jgi:Flp pilus assembly secretin CpaC